MTNHTAGASGLDGIAAALAAMRDAALAVTDTLGRKATAARPRESAGTATNG
jgi:hypothetical protein